MKRRVSICLLLLLVLSLALAPLPGPGAPPSAQAQAQAPWLGEYFANETLSGEPVLRREDPQINFDWGFGSPAPQVPVDHFSVRWTSNQSFAAGTYRFTVETDDGARLWIGDDLVIDQWQVQAPTVYTADRAMSAGQHVLRLEYFERTERAVIRLSWAPLDAAPTPGPWRAEYFANRNLAGDPVVVRNEARIDHNWGLGSPDPRVPADSFSARWTATLQLAGGRYRFTTETDDGVRLFINSVLVIDRWHDQIRTAYSVERDLAGGPHTIRMEYYEHTGQAFARLTWERLDEPAVLTGGGNIVTCTLPPARTSWTKVYRLQGGQWVDVNPQGWGPVSESGFLKIDGLIVDTERYGEQGHPYRVELHVDGSLACAVGDTARGQPEFRVQPGQDNQTPWGCPAPETPAQCPVAGFGND